MLTANSISDLNLNIGASLAIIETLEKITLDKCGKDVTVGSYSLSRVGQGTKVGVGAACRHGKMNGRKVRLWTNFYVYIGKDDSVSVSFLGERVKVN